VYNITKTNAKIEQKIIVHYHVSEEATRVSVLKMLLIRKTPHSMWGVYSKPHLFQHAHRVSPRETTDSNRSPYLYILLNPRVLIPKRIAPPMSRMNITFLQVLHLDILSRYFGFLDSGTRTWSDSPEPILYGAVRGFHMCRLGLCNRRCAIEVRRGDTTTVCNLLVTGVCRHGAVCVNVS
jgi:hypothetical protein